ncbi:MAG: methyltransferase domain-containing protein [Chloroflexi bacterium]|nr:methyltransferase domain-containing protein [Chloroflexota bacterium]
MTALDPRQVLGDIDGGRVLDVATGAGGFVGFLLDGLRGHGEIIGIDANPARGAAFAEAFGDRDDVRFVEMDAHRLAFADGSFDTVCVSNSLHHFADPAPVLAEMLRVVRPGGHVVVNEMYRDSQSETQMTHVLLHHWWAAVNTAGGEVHRETYRRAEILAILDDLGLAGLRLADVADPDEDPHDPATLADLEAAIDRHVALAAGHPDLERRGEELRARLRATGARGATQLVAVGRR